LPGEEGGIRYAGVAIAENLNRSAAFARPAACLPDRAL
jgi:hypothetical protein